MTLQALKDKLQELCYKGYSQYEVLTKNYDDDFAPVVLLDHYEDTHKNEMYLELKAMEVMKYDR